MEKINELLGHPSTKIFVLRNFLFIIFSLLTTETSFYSRHLLAEFKSSNCGLAYYFL